MVVNHRSNNAMFAMYSPSLLRANLWELRSWFGCIVKQDDVQSQSRVWTHPHLLKTTNISSRLDLSWWWTPNHFTAPMRRKRKQMWPEMMTSFFMPHRQFSCHGLSCVQNITYFVGGQFCDMWESRMCVYVKTGPPTRFYGWGPIQVAASLSFSLGLNQLWTGWLWWIGSSSSIWSKEEPSGITLQGWSPILRKCSRMLRDVEV